jgi:DnaD/phage-associated family protein
MYAQKEKVNMQKSYYAIIPANVRYDDELTPNAKLLYGEITALCNEKGYCWAGNGYFASLYNKNKSTIARWLKDLEDKGYITREVIYKEGTLEIEHRYMRICNGGTGINETTPIGKNERDNTTSSNTTSNNTKNKAATTAIQFYQQNFGIMSPILMQDINDWAKDFNGNEDVIIHALKIAIDRNVRNWGYTKGILKDWHGKGAKNLTDVEALENENRSKGSVRNGKNHAAEQFAKENQLPF